MESKQSPQLCIYETPVNNRKFIYANQVRQKLHFGFEQTFHQTEIANKFIFIIIDAITYTDILRILCLIRYIDDTYDLIKMLQVLNLVLLVKLRIHKNNHRNIRPSKKN